MSCVQMDLFELSEIENLRSEVRCLEKSMDNVRRGIFSRHDELSKKYMEMREEIEGLRATLYLMKDTMKHYEEALFSTEFVASGVGVGVKSTTTPVSSFIISSQASSTGLSLPMK